jgi:hypothetical protein
MAGASGDSAMDPEGSSTKRQDCHESAWPESLALAACPSRRKSSNERFFSFGRSGACLPRLWQGASARYRARAGRSPRPPTAPFGQMDRCRSIRHCARPRSSAKNPRKKMIAAFHLDNFALECPRTEQEHYPERTGICPRLERYCRSLGQPRRPEILPRWASWPTRGFGGAARRRYQPNGGSQMSKAAKKLIICFDCSPRCQKSLTAGS